MALTNAEKQRRFREKLKRNAEKHEEIKKKARERYHATKRLAKDMSERELRKARRTWKRKQATRRMREKAATPPVTPPGTPVLSQRERNITAGRKRVRRDRGKLYRENLKLQNDIKKYKRKIETLRKRQQRSAKSNEDQAKGKYSILSKALKLQYNKLKTRKEKNIIKDIFESDIVKKSGLKTVFLNDCLGIKRLKRSVIKEKVDKGAKRRIIEKYFLRDDISRASAGKKETLTKNKIKHQKRYLMDTMVNLHKLFLEEFQEIKCSYSYFTRCRPFYVVEPSVDARETCLCKIHANCSLKALALYKKRAIFSFDLSNILTAVTCDTNLESCMMNLCHVCKNKNPFTQSNVNADIEWSEWIRKEEEYINKEGKKLRVFKTVKDTKKGTVEDLQKDFATDLVKFKKHVFNIKQQFKSYRSCIHSLNQNEVVLHIDFSENYECKYHAEIQSLHFGGSREQVSLHTGVIYSFSNPRVPEITSFCTLSSKTNHQPSAIWAHLDPILKFIQQKNPKVDTIHFFSDGPSNQYRQKHNFYLMASQYFSYGFKSLTWSFFEAGHGKGAADGIGGCLKRIADGIVAKGDDIVNVVDFINKVQSKTKIKLFLIENEAIESISQKLPKNIKPLPGTLQVHQIFSNKINVLHYRDLSCFCSSSEHGKGFCNCYNPKEYSPIPCAENKSMSNSQHLSTMSTQNYKYAKKSFYDLVYSSSSDEDPEHGMDVDLIPTPGPSNYKPKTIKCNSFLLVNVKGEKDSKLFKYVAISQSSFDDADEIKVMFLRSIDNSNKVFKVNEDDISFIREEDIICTLPEANIKMKGVRIFYEFNSPVDIFEKK